MADASKRSNTGSAKDEETFADLTNNINLARMTLGSEVKSAINDFRRKAFRSGRHTSHPGVNFIEDTIKETWKPVPKVVVTEEDRKAHRKGFNSIPRNTGGEFQRLLRVKPEPIHPSVKARLLQPDRTSYYPRETTLKGVRFHAQSEPISAPTDDMCSKQHRTWLDGHYKQRDHHLHRAYHALQRRDHLHAKIESNALAMARSASISSSSDWQRQSDADKRLKDALKETNSLPTFWPRQPTPEAQARHLREWAGPNRELNHTMQDWVPWQRVHENVRLTEKDRANRLRSQRSSLGFNVSGGIRRDPLASTMPKLSVDVSIDAGTTHQLKIVA